MLLCVVGGGIQSEPRSAERLFEKRVIGVATRFSAGGRPQARNELGEETNRCVRLEVVVRSISDVAASHYC